MKKVYAFTRLFRKAARAVAEEQQRPAADTPERRATFARVDRLAERLSSQPNVILEPGRLTKSHAR